MESRYLTKELVDQAIELVTPVITALFQGPAERNHLCIMVRDPTREAEPVGLVVEKRFGKIDEWQHEYGKYARGKALVAVRHRRDVSTIFASTNPDVYLEDGDPLYIGGVYMTDDQLQVILGMSFAVAVGTSGVQEALDEAISRMVGAMIIGLLKLRLADQFSKPCPDDRNWVGDNANVT